MDWILATTFESSLKKKNTFFFSFKITAEHQPGAQTGSPDREPRPGAQTGSPDREPSREPRPGAQTESPDREPRPRAQTGSPAGVSALALV